LSVGCCQPSRQRDWTRSKHCATNSPLITNSSPTQEEGDGSRLLYNPLVAGSPDSRLERVLAQLRFYEHPLLDFGARENGEGVEVIIQFKNSPVPVHTYYFALHPRDLDHPQFEWTFQRQLYDCLHDYLVEMFIRTPQDLADRRQKGL